MNHHFAASWLQSLSGKLESLTPWSWTANRQGSVTTHRNLFREFFSAPFQKTLALVDQQKKTDFLSVIEQNLHKFDESTQQFPLGCLCALLQHGKDSPRTQDKVVAWVDFLLERLRGRGAWETSVAQEVVEECLSPPFQKFVPLMEQPLRARLADGLGEHLGRLPEDVQKRAFEGLPALPERIQQVVEGFTQELNSWLATAPCYPGTPLVIADVLQRMENPSVRLFTTALKDKSKKEAFLLAVALALMGLRTRFQWMCSVELELESLSKELQRRFFTVDGELVMDRWLPQRMKTYNVEVTARTASLLVADPSKAETLRARLQQLLTGRAGSGPEDLGWLPVDGPNPVADALLAWLSESSPGFFVPQHTVLAETLFSVLQRFGKAFEVDAQGKRVRLGSPAADPPPPKEPPTPPLMQPPSTPPPPLTSPGQGQLVPVGIPPLGATAPATVPPPQTIPGTGLALLRTGAAPMTVPPPPQIPPPPTTPPPPQTPAPRPQGGEVDNLIDLLLNEALEGMSSEIRAKIVKVGHGVYRFGIKEVTLHTQNGRLYVYRVGEVLRHVPIQTLLQEEGLAPQALPAAPSAAAATAASSGAADTSSVAKIALQAKQISAGVTTTTTAALLPPSAPFGGTRPVEQKSDPNALMSKRVEAATKAADVSKQIVRRSVNFEDDKLLRRLLDKGLKHDRGWQNAYEDYCTSHGITDPDIRHQDRDFIATFIEQNLANSINEDWVKKILWNQAPDGEKKEKKEKKEGKEKKEKKDKKKDKRRKASGSSSGSEAGVGATPSGSLGVPRPGAPMDMPMMMSMYGAGMPMGMSGMMGQMGSMGGMLGPMGMPALGDVGMQTMGADPMDDTRGRKRQKTEKADKGKKEKERTEKGGKTRR